MISKFSQIIELFKEINSVMSKVVHVYTIGGAVLIEQGLKEVTKDIDLVVDTKEEFIDFQKALEKTGFTGKMPGKEYTHMNLSQIFQKGDYRIDLFEKKVCGVFSLTEGMKRRARKVIDLEHAKAYLCSNEDIFLFKTMTEREGDLEDCENLLIPDTDWEAIMQEIKAQIHQSKQDVWVTWIGERLDLLEDRGIEIPIMNEVNELRDKYYYDLERKQSG